MKKKKTGVAIITIPILAAGTVALAASYQSDINFKPQDSSQSVQVNQVVFDGNDTGTGNKKNKDSDESHLLQKKSDTGDATSLEDQANYLFENSQLHTESIGITDNRNTEASNTDSTHTKQAQPSSIYNVTNDSSKADTVLDNSQGNVVVNPNGNNSGTSTSGNSGTNPDRNNNNNTNPASRPSNPGNGNSNNGNNGGNNNGGSNNGNNGGGNNSGSNSGDNSGGNTVRPADNVKDPESEKSNTNTGHGFVQKPYQEGVDPGQKDEETGDYKNVTIYKSSNESGNLLYEGQTVTKKDIYNALETWVYGNDGVQYLWGADALDKYIRIDSVSFDGGKTWISDFPLTLPESQTEEKLMMNVKVSYRISEKDTAWIERKVDYDVEPNRIFVLSEQLKEGTTVIDKSKILNTNQHPTKGSTIYFYDFLPGMLGYDDLTALVPGWTENDQLLSWRYPVEKGRHILEPADLVPLKKGYQAQLSIKWMNPDTGEIGDGMEYNKLVYLQTLTGVTEDALSQDKDGKKVLSVPKYMQAVDLANDAEVETDYLEIPDTVLVMNTDFSGLHVKQGYRVDEANSVYGSTSEGVLTDKTKKVYLGVPSAIKTLRIPETVTKVNLSSNNEISTLYIEAAILDEMPEISYDNLKKCKTIVKDALLNSFIEKNYDSLKDKGNTIAAEENPEVTYTVKNEGIVSNRGELRKVFKTGRHSFRIPSDIKTIQSGAFDEVNDLTEVIMPRNGEVVELQKDCFKGSELATIRCYSEEQYESVKEQLDASGAPDGVSVEFVGKSQEGIGYVRAEKDGAEEITVIDAPSSITSFDGTLTAENGEKLSATAIGDDAFENCRDLMWADLAESVKSIGYQAFRNCSSMQWLFINSTDYIYIGDKSMEGCGSLRFIASNAVTGEMQNSYNPGVVNEGGEATFYVPTNSEGYEAGSIHFTDGSGVYSYSMIDIGDGYKMLYGLNEEGTPWLGIRSGISVPDQVSLPATTEEIYTYGMANTTSPSGSYTVNWNELTAFCWLDGGIFQNSDLGGEVLLIGEVPSGYAFYIGDNCFYGCKNITSVKVPQDSYNVYAGAFAECSSLRSAEFGGVDTGAVYIGSFSGCNNLSDITFDSVNPITLTTYGSTPYRFNTDWSAEEEAEHVRIHVPEGSEMTYIKAWRYLFCGYVDYFSDTAYMHMWQDIQMENMNMETYEYPSDETVMELLEQRLLVGENRLRSMLGVGTVGEPTELYHYSYSNWMLTLLRVPSGLTSLDLSDTDGMELPPYSSVDYIGSNLFVKSPNLQYLNLSFWLSGIYENALAGITSEKITLNFESTTPPQLIDVTGDTTFNFGVTDEQLSIQVPEGSEEDYIEAWKYPLSGYTDEEAVRQAAIANLTAAGTEGEPTDEEISLEMQRILLPTVNRLRGMMGMELIDASTLEDKQKELAEEKSKSEETQVPDQNAEETGENTEQETPEEDNAGGDAGQEDGTDAEDPDNAGQEENPDAGSDNADGEQPEQPENPGENTGDGENESEDASEDDSTADSQEQIPATASEKSEEETQE